MLRAEPGSRGPDQHRVVDGPTTGFALPVRALVDQGEGPLHVGELLLDGVQDGPVDVELGRGAGTVKTVGVKAVGVKAVGVKTDTVGVRTHGSTGDA